MERNTGLKNFSKNLLKKGCFNKQMELSKKPNIKKLMQAIGVFKNENKDLLQKSINEGFVVAFLPMALGIDHILEAKRKKGLSPIFQKFHILHDIFLKIFLCFLFYLLQFFGQTLIF